MPSFAPDTIKLAQVPNSSRAIVLRLQTINLLEILIYNTFETMMYMER